MATFLQLLLLFISSLLLTHIALVCFHKRSWFDIPNHRSSHQTPVPKSGGIAFTLVYIIFCSWLFWRGDLNLFHYLALIMAVPLAVMGLIDDFINLAISVRLSVQGLCALVMLLLLGGFPPIPLGSMNIELGWTGYLVGVLAIMWLINLYNFMDGIDGIAILEAAFVSLAAAFFSWQNADAMGLMLAVGLFASCAGFALLNLPPARIFMGDTGSNFLGGVLAVLGLIHIQSGALTVWTWLILLGVFISDSTFTLLRRARQKEVWYHAHRSHAYQQAAVQMKSHARVDLAVTLINFLWLFPLAWMSVNYKSAGGLLACVAYAPMIAICYYCRAGSGMAQEATEMKSRG